MRNHFQYWMNTMIYRPLFIVVLIAAGMAGSCVSQMASTPGTPSVSSPFSPFSPPFKTPSTPDASGEFFPDPKVAALARTLEHNDWTGAAKALSAGADVNAIGQDDMTLPMWAMYVKNKKAFEWLFKHGANPNFDPGHNRCALFWAARAEDTDWLRILLAHKANPNLTHTNSIGSTETPLMALAMERRLTNLKMLIAAGADVNYQQPSGGHPTAASMTAQFGWFEGTYVLLEAGADFRPKGAVDLTYLVVRRTLSKDPFREKVIQLLRARGADIDGAMKMVSDEEAQDRKDNPWRYQENK
jgi:hypothetical protein